MDRYKGCEDGVEMSCKFNYLGSLGKRLLIQTVMMSIVALLIASCGTTVEQTKPSQPDLPRPTFTSPSPNPTTELTSTPTPAPPTTTPTVTFLTSSTPKPPTPTEISDELSPTDLTAYKETQEAYEHALLLTPSPTSTLDVPLNENGPWLVDRTLEDVIAMNLDGTGLTRMTINPGPHSRFLGPQSMTLVTSGNWLALTIGKHPDSREAMNRENAPYDLAIQLLQLPPGKFSKVLPLLSAELILQLKQDDDKPVWTFPNVFYTLLNSPILWSPDGRYLAFVAALDGPSSDLYVYDKATDQIRRLTDGPNEAFLLSWSPDSQWILHVEATSYATRTVLTSAYPRAKAVWVASPDGSQVRKIYDANDEMIQAQGWLSPSVYVEQTYIDYSPYHTNIRTVNILTGELTPIFPCFGSVTATTTNGDIVFWSFGYDEHWMDYPQYPCKDPLPAGFYVLKDGNLIPLSQIPDIAHWNGTLEKFFVGTARGLEVWDLSGQLMMTFSQGKCEPKVSPDGQWLAFWSPCGKNLQRSQEIRLHNSQGDFLRDYDLQVDRFSWKQDSSGIFFEVGDQLWFQPLQDGEPILIHPDCGIYPPIVVGE
jgi:hypothetical protein